MLSRSCASVAARRASAAASSFLSRATFARSPFAPAPPDSSAAAGGAADGGAADDDDDAEASEGRPLLGGAARG